MSDKPMIPEDDILEIDEALIEPLPPLPSRIVAIPLERKGWAQFPADYPPDFDDLPAEEE
ncbi:MAG: hypothetical protein K2W96_20245 [Gemmataceae bacterium]|nr:hypothetical protein [Gemmataceae bacterium]